MRVVGRTSFPRRSDQTPTYIQTLQRQRSLVEEEETAGFVLDRSRDSEQVFRQTNQDSSWRWGRRANWSGVETEGWGGGLLREGKAGLLVDMKIAGSGDACMVSFAPC